MAHVTVLGAGYVGLVTGACLAELGHDVTCVEKNAARLEPLRDGRLPFHEPDLDGLVAKNVASGRLSFASSAGEAVSRSDFVFVAVQTPSRPDGSADTSFLFGAVHEIAPSLRPTSFVVIKSTVPVGTGDEVAARLTRNGTRAEVVSNPEFLRQGSAVRDFLSPDRVVVGAETEEARWATLELFAGIEAPVVRTTRRAAEMGKYAANALLATRISFMNEVSGICEGFGVDIDEVASIVGHDSRLGKGYLRAGLGWGGSCFPKDIRSLASMGRQAGMEPEILVAADTVNARQRQRAVFRLRETVLLDGHRDPVVGVLGLAFKPDTDDLRESPALDVIARLQDEGIRIQAHDPAAIPAARAAMPSVHYTDSPYEAAANADALLLATEWPEYQALDWGAIRTSMRGKTVLDGRNVLDGALLRALGFRYLSFGKAPFEYGRAMDLESSASATVGL